MTRGLPVLLAVVLVVVLVAVVVARAAPRSAGPTARAPASLPTPLGVPTRAGVPTPASVPTPEPGAACHYRVAASGAYLPDPACTPGAANPELTREVLCAPGFSTRRYRRVTEAQKRAVFSRYGIAAHQAGEYEVDHLIALEDGGSNEAANLWPQPAGPAPGFHQKDVVETYVHRQVCAGQLDLAQGQQQIARDWTALVDVASRAGLAPKQHTDDGDEAD